MNFRIILLGLLSFYSTTVFGDECSEWFKVSKLKPGSSCLVQCSVLKVDMDTFACHDRCPEFCASAPKEKYLFELSALYPSLTAQERALAASEPKKVAKAFQLTWQTETICSQLYPTSRTNDESDACRHFVWAALLVNEFGKDFSEKILDAHEQEVTQPEVEKAMDLANNRRGVSVAEELIKEKSFSESRVIQSFKQQLKDQKLVILKKGTGAAK